jgi:hypothetical protein
MTDALTLDPLAVWIAAAWLATLMLHAGLAKTLDRALFVQHLAAYRVPEAAWAPLSLGLPALELLCGALLLSPWRGAGAWLAGTLLLLYAAAMAWHRAQGRALDCGCGGPPLPLSWSLVLRNAGLALLCLPAGARMDERSAGWADLAVVLAAVLLGALLWALFHQVLRQVRRTHPV